MTAESLALWPAPVACELLGGRVALGGPVCLKLGPGAKSWSTILLDRLAWLRVRPAPGDPRLCR